ncbi:hypothetical protein LJR175_008215 [Variovorax sp. LjRoot175]|uniref:hypothetical protein n=1 Tax=Variovorax sp. LjRoot175 TaxID=3342276 RepID=UPI003ED12C85
MTIAEAVATGEIRNVTLQEAKATLSGAVQEAWRRYINDRHFSGEVWRDGSMTEALLDLYYMVSVYGLHDVHAAAKRVAATGVEGPAVEAMRALLQELLPLAKAVSGLKDKVIKGREPTAPQPPSNPDQLRMTCGCCTRAIAVLGGTPTGTMAHHGYERPGHGWQTASCPGVRFMPLETTDDGPRFMLKLRASQLDRAQAALERCPHLTKLPVMVLERGVKTMKEITPEMPAWRKAYAAHVGGIESEIRALERDISQWEQIIRDWQPSTEAARALLIDRARRAAGLAASANAAVPTPRDEGASEPFEPGDGQESCERMTG